VRVIESLWLVEVGRRLLFRRSAEPDWQRTDASEHREVLEALREGSAADAERLMARHVRRAVHHWEPERHGTDGT
jgi:DNA-binding GntR family transcriptional regulator